MDKFHWSPQLGAGSSIKPKIKEINFGDGYSQRSPDGINNNLRSHSVSFLEKTIEIASIDLFLSVKNGVDAFLFCPHGEWEDRKVICKEWSTEHLGTYSKLTATFQEVVA